MPEVVASRWSVDGESSRSLMDAFYGGLQAGKDAGEAMVLARAAVRKISGFEHPYFWAGFSHFVKGSGERVESR